MSDRILAECNHTKGSAPPSLQREIDCFLKLALPINRLAMGRSDYCIVSQVAASVFPALNCRLDSALGQEDHEFGPRSLFPTHRHSDRFPHTLGVGLKSPRTSIRVLFDRVSESGPSGAHVGTAPLKHRLGRIDTGRLDLSVAALAVRPLRRREWFPPSDVVPVVHVERERNHLDPAARTRAEKPSNLRIRWRTAGASLRCEHLNHRYRLSRGGQGHGDQGKSHHDQRYAAPEPLVTGRSGLHNPCTTASSLYLRLRHPECTRRRA